MGTSDADYDAHKDEIEALSKDELIKGLIDMADESVSSLDDEAVMEQKTYELIQEELRIRDEFNRFVSRFPEVVFTQQAKDFNTYMTKSEAFAKKAEVIKPVLDELRARCRKQIEEMAIDKSVSDEHMKQTNRLIKAYQNSHKFWLLAMDEYTKVIQMVDV